MKDYKEVLFFTLVVICIVLSSGALYLSWQASHQPAQQLIQNQPANPQPVTATTPTPLPPAAIQATSKSVWGKTALVTDNTSIKVNSLNQSQYDINSFVPGPDYIVMVNSNTKYFLADQTRDAKGALTQTREVATINDIAVGDFLMIDTLQNVNAANAITAKEVAIWKKTPVFK